MLEEKELEKHSAVRSCQAGGSGEAGGVESTSGLVWVLKYILVRVYIGMPIKLFFFVRKSGGGGGGGGVQANFSGIRILKSQGEAFTLASISYLAILVK